MSYMTERRDGRRNLFTVTIEYSLTDEVSDKFIRKGQGLTTNISNNGIGLILTAPVEEGQRIALYGEKLTNNPLTGSVRWCTKISDGIYRTGLRLN